MTCHAGMPATALARSSVGSHHHASGARVMLIHDEPSRLGALWMRIFSNSRRSPACLSQKSRAYFFAGSALSWNTTLGNQPYTGRPRTTRTSSSTKLS